MGFRVRRQYSCNSYILDFYVHAARLCIEVDGPDHDPAKDRARDLALAERGIMTVRIPFLDLPDKLPEWSATLRALCASRVALFERVGYP